MVVPLAASDENTARQETPIRICIPTTDIPDGVTGAQAQSAAKGSQTVGVKTGYPTVGKFFFKVAQISFNCTGSVVGAAYEKPARVLVAAHCLFGDLDNFTYKTGDWSFAPDWHDNKAPFGTWKFSEAYYPVGWPSHCLFGHCDFNPRYDFALLVAKNVNGKSTGTVTGYDGWQIDDPRTASVAIAGIAGNGSDTLLSRMVSHTVDPGGVLAREASTPGFGDGSSGGPASHAPTFIV
jgi:hypothetical protein